MKKKISRRKIKLVYRIFIRLYCHLFSCCWTTLLHIYNLPTRLLQHRFAQLKFESPLQALQLGNAVRIYLSIIGSTWKVFYYFMLLLLFKSANGEISLLNKHTSRGTANVNKHNESPYFCIISVMKLLYYNAIVWQWCEGACPSHRCTPCTLLLSLITAGLESARASARSVAHLIGKPMWAELRPVSGRPCGSPDSLRCSPASE